MAAPSDFLSGVIGKVTFVNKWPLLLKATQDDATPTPGYLFKEIADITYESGSNCQCLVDFLVERLDKKSCHVKFKVLKIMLYMVDKGHPAFCEGLRRKAHGIQASSKCSGPPDPLHGMAPYVAVRKAAKDLSERLFDTETLGLPLTNQSSRQSHMTNDALMSREGSTMKMEGFGNTPDTPQKSVSIESLGETMKGGLQHIANKLSGENRSAVTFTQSDTGYKPLHGYDPSSINTAVRQGLMPSHSSICSAHQSITPSDYSPVMMRDDDNRDEMREHSFGSSKEISSRSSPHQRSDDPRSLHGFTGPFEHSSLIDTSSHSRGDQSNGSKSSDQLSGAGSDLSERLASVSVADWSEEVSTVEELISTNHESRPTPTKEELQKFVKRSQSLNCEKMIELLTSHLVSSNNARLHCLFGIEGILKADLISSDVALNLLTPHLTSVQASEDKAIRAKALKILRQLERLEADTRLDQPIMQESQLVSQTTSECTEREELVSSAKSTPVKHVPPGLASESQFLLQSVLDTTENEVPGSLYQSALITQADTGSAAERQVRTQSIQDTTDTDAPGSSANSTPVRHAAPASMLVAQESERTLFSGMNVTRLSASAPRGNENSRTLISGNTANTMSERNHDDRLLLDMNVIPTSTSSEADLLFSDTPSNHGVMWETNIEKKCYGNGSGTVNVASEIPTTKQSVTGKGTYKKSIDPIMSREAGFADLWNTVSPKDSTASPNALHQTQSQLRGASPQLNASRSQHPSVLPHQSVLTAQHIASMYPQLSSAKLSGTTSTPINLSRKPTTGFGFVADSTDESQKAGTSSRDAFSFIQDAMRDSKS